MEHLPEPTPLTIYDTFLYKPFPSLDEALLVLSTANPALDALGPEQIHAQYQRSLRIRLPGTGKTLTLTPLRIEITTSIVEKRNLHFAFRPIPGMHPDEFRFATLTPLT